MKKETPHSTAEEILAKVGGIPLNDGYIEIDRNRLLAVMKEYASQFTTTPTSGQEGETWVWTDDLVKQYAEEYRYSSTRISVKQFKNGIHFDPAKLLENYEIAIAEANQEKELEGGQEVSREGVKRLALEYARSFPNCKNFIPLEDLKEGELLDNVAASHYNGFIKGWFAASTPTNKGQESALLEALKQIKDMPSGQEHDSEEMKEVAADAINEYLKTKQ